MTHCYLTSQSGAVTVDWVVLTAGLVGLGLATMSVVSNGVQDAATDTGSQLTSTVVTTDFRTAEGVTYGLFGAPIVNTWFHDQYTAEYASGDPATLRAEYLTAQAIVQDSISQEFWGIGTGRNYHRMLTISEELARQGEPLPDGALMANDAIQQVGAYNEWVADQL